MKKMKKYFKGLSKSARIVTVLAAALIIVSVFAGIKSLAQTVMGHSDGKKIVCLDAGHGGKDVGAASRDGKRLEKDDNLRLTLKVKEELEKLDVKVVLTRKTDTEVSLEERCKTANKKHCDLFVAIHRNSSESDSSSGIEAWISSNANHQEKSVANSIVDSLCEVDTQQNRGVKKGFRDNSASNYYINSNTKMPSLLLEVGFITNNDDNEAFDKNLDEYARAIANTINKKLR